MNEPVEEQKPAAKTIEMEKNACSLRTAIHGLAMPIVRSMREGGIKNLSVTDNGVFVVQLTDGQVISGGMSDSAG